MENDKVPAEVPTILSTGVAELNDALGIGGLPRGRVIELFGPDAPSTAALVRRIMATAQDGLSVTVALVDVEHTFQPELTPEIDCGRLLVSQPDSGEDALDIVEALVRSGAVDLVVIDSVASLTPRAELEGQMGGDGCDHTGLQAQLMSQALRKITSLAGRTGCTVLFVNRVRRKIVGTFGNGVGDVVFGGNALKFYASVRMECRSEGDKTVVKIVKNKFAPPFRRTGPMEV
jgi:recombination protein RecA